MDFLTNKSNFEELVQQLHDAQERLHETELQLAEKDIENVQLKIKYNACTKQSDYWKAQYIKTQSALNMILNSKTWIIRNFIMAPRIRHQQRRIPAQNTEQGEQESKVILTTALNELPENFSWEKRLLESPRIAIQIHVFYPDLVKDICEHLANFPFKYDLYITTTESYKATYIKEHLIDYSSAENFHIKLVENKGRDVIPFLNQMQPVLSNYDYICHLHTKRSLHNDTGKRWRNYLYDNLIGNTTHIKKIISEFEHNPKIGVIFPEIPTPINQQIDWASNKEDAQMLMETMGFNAELPEDILFPAGTMFWARTSAVKELFNIDFESTIPIPEETGQVDGTIMHAIERLWLLVAEYNGYTYRMFPNISQIENISPEKTIK